MVDETDPAAVVKFLPVQIQRAQIASALFGQQVISKRWRHTPLSSEHIDARYALPV